MWSLCRKLSHYRGGDPPLPVPGCRHLQFLWLLVSWVAFQVFPCAHVVDICEHRMWEWQGVILRVCVCLGNKPQTEAVGSGARLWGLTSGSSLHLLSAGITEHPAPGFVPQTCRSGVPFCVVLHGAGSFLLTSASCFVGHVCWSLCLFPS